MRLGVSTSLQLIKSGSSQVPRAASAGLSLLQFWRPATRWLQRPAVRNSLLLVEQYGQRVLPVALDVTNAAAAQAAVEAAVNRFGRIDVLVNSAGYANIAPVKTAPEEDFHRQFETNFWGVYNVSKAVLPALKRQGPGTHRAVFLNRWPRRRHCWPRVVSGGEVRGRRVHPCSCHRDSAVRHSLPHCRAERLRH